MILPGKPLILRKIVNKVLSAELQAQPCGVDLTLKRVLTWTSPGVVDFDNSLRRSALSSELLFTAQSALIAPLSSGNEQTDDKTKKPTISDSTNPSETDFVDLPLGSYLVQFNKTVDVPLDIMGQIYVRSSLFRSGALVNAGLMDSGYKGAIGAMLQVVNPHGLRLYRDAKLAQIVFHQVSEAVEGYKGIYQGRVSM